MKKRLLSFILLLFAGITAAYAYSFSKVAPTGQTLYYTITSSGSSPKVRVTYPSSGYPFWSSNYTKPTGSLTIPSTVTYSGTTYSVTSIGSHAFYDCSSLTSVTIPNSVIYIGESAFSCCSGLTSVNIPNSVTSIRDYTFSGCSGLTSVNIPNSVTSIGNYAFSGCSGLSSVTIPNSVTSIGDDAFSGCSGLTTAVYNSTLFVFMPCSYSGDYSIPTGVTTICGGAFYDCIGLTSITIPNSVTSIGWAAFYNCRSLNSITIPNSVTSIGGRAFSFCRSLTSVTIPNSVTSIGGDAFKYCTSLSSVTIPNSVDTIFDDSFSYCTSLSSVTIPNSVTFIARSAFYNCTSLSSVTIPNSVTSIRESTFEKCSSLASVTIPNSVTTIWNSAFRECTSLSSVTIPNSVTSIEGSAFYNCTSLSSVSIPNSVTSIGGSAFYNCTSLSSVTIPNSVTSIGRSAFHYIRHIEYHGTATGAPWEACSMNGVIDGDFVFSNTNKDTLIGYIGNGGAVSIPNSVTSIGDSAFYNCRSLTSVTIPNSVTSIGEYAFFYDTSLSSVSIPNSVTSIGDSAFSYCTSLSSVTIGNSVTSIGKYAFEHCYSLSSVTIGNSVTSIGNYAFRFCYRLTSITVSSGNPVYDSRSNCNAIIHTATNTLVIGCQNTTIPNSVTSIGNNAFFFCNRLTSITIPNSVTSIGGDAFYSCTSLSSVTIPNSVTSIGGAAFYYCTSLSSVTIPNSVTSIGDSAFGKCSSLSSVIIPNSVTSIGKYAFYHDTSLSSVFIPNSVTSIGNYAFYNCTSLSSVTIPNSVTSIGNNAFFFCNRLTSITIPNSVTSIGGDAFYSCTSLSSVTIGNSVTSIGNFAFSNCTSLASVTSKRAIAPNLGWDVFCYVPQDIPVYIPCGRTASYSSGSSRWNSFSNFIEMMFDSIRVSSADSSMGSAIIVTQPTCTLPTATISAIPNTGYTFINWTEDNSVVSTDSTYSFTVTADRTLTAHFAPAASCGITATDLPYTDNFDSYTTSTTAKTGVEPDCWTLAHQDVVMTDEYKPMIYYSSANAHSGSYSLLLNKRGIYAMPEYDGDVSALQLSMYVKQGMAKYQLQVGVMSDLTDASTFVTVATINNSSTAPVLNTVSFANYTGSGHYIAFRNILASGYSGDFSCNYIDDLVLDIRPANTCGISTDDLPYTDNFDSYTNSTTAKTGVEPDCWTLAHQYVVMTDAYKPMVYYNSTYAHSGRYSLIINKRGIYAMPEYDGDVSTLQLRFYLCQPQAKYQLQVGVMSNLSNESSFVPVATLNNSSTTPELKTVNFASYTGSGHYIAFRNILASGYTGDYSCNYIDDISLSVAPITTSYTVTATANPTAGGTVTGGGTYTSGSSCTLTATPATGFAFTNWTSGNTVVSTNATYTFTITTNRTLTANFTAVTSCGISVADLPYTDNFDSYTNSTTAKTGVEPGCWTMAHQYVAITDAYKPMVYYNSTYAHSGHYSLIINKRCIYAMPEFDGDVSTLQLRFYLCQPQAKFQLQVGVMSNLNNESSFVPVSTINNSSTTPELKTVDFSSYTGSGHYIAFRNILASGYTGDFSCNYIDDLNLSVAPATTNYTIIAIPTAGGTVSGAGTYASGSSCTLRAIPASGYTFANWTSGGSVVSTNATYTFTVTSNRTLTANFSPVSACGISVADLPYTDNFDSYTNSTTAKTGVEPTCWALVHQDVVMTDGYKPMIYYSPANARSGSYSLILNKRGIYAMPEFEGNVNTLWLMFSVKQTALKNQLQVGVMTDPTDASTFLPYVTIDNTSYTAYENYIVSFVGYSDTGHYIAFRNILAPGYTGDFSCNYIDDLTLCVAGDAGKSAEYVDVTPSHHHLNIYPNPTTGVVNVTADEEVQRVEVYDRTGRRVTTFERQSTIDLSRFATGIYTLRVILPERIEVRRVVKQ